MRIACLDPLRALLAWWVVAIHVLWLSGYPVVGAGAAPVNGFIVLSGLVISLLLERGQENYRLFILRRFLRLFPVYLCCLALALVVLWLVPLPGVYEPSVALSERHFFWIHLLAHLSLLHGAIPEIWLPHASMTLLSPAWSISLEWQFYLLAPVLVWLTLRQRVLACVLFVLSMVVLWPPIGWRLHVWDSEMGSFLPQKFYLFLCGALLARYAPLLARLKLPSWSCPLRWLGQISYPTYLVHLPVLLAFNALLPPLAGRLHALTLFAWGAPVIVCLSALLHSFVERPAIALGKRLNYDQKHNSSHSAAKTWLRLNPRRTEALPSPISD